MTPRKPTREPGAGGIAARLKSVEFSIYLSHTLSSWGDRMWRFAVALLLMALYPDTLRYVAVYGFSVGGCILLFGSIVGDWIDRNERLKVAKIALFIQNSCVTISAVILCFVFGFEYKMKTVWGGDLEAFCVALVIIVACIAALASMAMKIAIEKDWVVVICHGDKGKLANLNAVVRRIDLVTNILAPAAVGQIMTYAGQITGAIFIAVWNVVSMCVEYYLLLRVYRMEPALAKKQIKGAPVQRESTPVPQMPPDIDHEEHEHEHDEKHEDETTKEKILTPTKEEEPVDNKIEVMEEEDYKNPYSATTVAEPEMEKSCLQLFFSKFIVLGTGWHTYWQQSVLFPGLGLAALYMTVLGFGSVTNGYAYSQGLSESILGIIMAVSSLVGISGTLLFTRCRKRCGLLRTGLFGFSAEICCLMLCVISLWTPGSPFIGYNDTTRSTVKVCDLKPNTTAIPTDVIALTTAPPSNTSDTNTTLLIRRRRSMPEPVLFQSNMVINDLLHFSHQRWIREVHSVAKRQSGDNNETIATNTTTASPAPVSKGPSDDGYTVLDNNETSPNENSTHICRDEVVHGSYVSIILFMTGITLARLGLWMADLTITQLQQENVDETERGVVFGVQNSLNMLMDMLKYLLVIIIPQLELFGILVLLSFSFVCTGGILYAIYSRRMRGHLFHFDRCCGKTQANGAPNTSGAPVVTDTLNPNDSSVA